MDEEKDIKKMANELHCATNESYISCRKIARILVQRRGYGNVKQAVKEFAEKLKQKIKSVFDIGFTGKTEKQLYQRRGMEEGLQMAIEIVDDLILELYREENK